MRLSNELRNRTKAFASSIIKIFTQLPNNRHEITVIARQMLRSGTSVAAHAREASRARSDAEFSSKLGGLLQEADETQLWLEFLMEDCKQNDPSLISAHQEAEELIAIFTSMIHRIN